MELIRRNIDLVLILVVGFVLRFTISYQHSYTNDELSAINRLRYDNFHDLIEYGVKTGDMHPAGVQVFMKGWSSVFGTSEIVLRLPFVLCGVLAIFMVFKTGNTWFNRRTGIFAAALLSVLYFPVLQSELARPYSPGLLIALLTAWFYHKVLFDDVKKYKNVVLLGLCFAAAMYTHYFLFLFVGFIGITGLFFLKKENFKHYLLAGTIGVLLFLPHLSVTLHHLGVGGLGWLGPPDNDFMFQFLFHVLNEAWILIAALFACVVISFFSTAPKEIFRSKYFLLICTWFFGIYIIGHVLSIVSTPLLKFPVMLFALPFFFLIIGVFVSRSGFYKPSLALIFVGGILSTTLQKDLYGMRHMGYRETARHMVEWNKQYGAENIYTVYNLSNPDYMNFYAKQFGDTVDFDWDVIEFSDDYNIRRDLMTRDERYCIVGYSERLTGPNVFETVKEFYPTVLDYYNYDNAAVFLMDTTDRSRPWHDYYPGIFREFDMFGSGALSSTRDSVTGLSKFSYVVDKERPYGPSITFRVSDVRARNENYMRILVYAKCPPGAQLTVTITGTRNGEALQHNAENFWLGHDLEEMLISTANTNGVGHAYFAFDIPDFIKDSDKITISLWNRGQVPVGITTFRIYLVQNIWQKTFPKRKKSWNALLNFD